MTLGALGALTLVGLARHEAIAELNHRALAHQATPSGVHAASPSEPVAAEIATADATSTAALTGTQNPAKTGLRPQQIVVETATEDPPELFMSPVDQKTTLESPASQSVEAAPTGDAVAPRGTSAGVQVRPTSPSGPEVTSPQARRAHHGSLAAPAPVSKSALLSAIRASRPAHGTVQKTR